MRVTGMIRIMASNVTIRRSEVYGYIQLMARDPDGGLRIEDSTVGPPSGVSDWIHGAIGVKAYTALRVEIRNMPDGFRVAGNDVLIQDSFFKAKPDGGCPHHDGVQGYYGGTNVIVRHNTLDVRAPCATLWDFFGDWSKEIQAFNNLVMGGAQSLKSNYVEHVNMLQRFHGNRIVENSWDYSPTHFDVGTFDLRDNRIVRIDSDYRVTWLGPNV